MPLTIDDFQAVSDRVPYLADLKPSGDYVQEDLHDVGGTPAVMKYLLAEGLLNGDCLTVTGKTLAENLAPLARTPSQGQDVVQPISDPIKATRPHPHPARQPGPRGGGGQDHRQGGQPVHRAGQGLRQRGGDARRPGAKDASQRATWW